MTQTMGASDDKMVTTYDTGLLTSNFIPLIYICNSNHLSFAQQDQRRNVQRKQTERNYFLKIICTWAGDHSLKLALSKSAEGNPKSEHRLFVYDPLMSVVRMAFSDKEC